MVYHHVQGVIDEVSDGEADEGVAGGSERGYQVVLHLRGLVVKFSIYDEKNTVLTNEFMIVLSAHWCSWKIHIELYNVKSRVFYGEV